MTLKNHRESRAEQVLGAVLGQAVGVGKARTGKVELSRKDWYALYDLAMHQMVGAVTYDCLLKLGNGMPENPGSNIPEEPGSNMPEDLDRRWKAHTDRCRERFEAELTALSILCGTMNAEGIRIMALKGVSLALSWPTPEYREFNDLDVYSFDDFDRVNNLVVSRNLSDKAEDDEEKHVCFNVYGINVENHRKFTQDLNRESIAIGEALRRMSQEEEPAEDPRLPGILFPSATMNLTHVIAHSLAHLAGSGIRLRHLCDIAAFYRANRDGIDFPRVHRTFKEVGMEKGASIILNTCRTKLGLEIDLAGWSEVTEKEIEDLYDSVIHPFKLSTGTKNPIRKFFRKVSMYSHRRKFYRIVYGEKYPHSFLSSFAVLRKED